MHLALKLAGNDTNDVLKAGYTKGDSICIDCEAFIKTLYMLWSCHVRLFG
jgi:hypothetical protein